jgi:hypothetical protein
MVNNVCLWTKLHVYSVGLARNLGMYKTNMQWQFWKKSSSGQLTVGHVPRAISRLCWYFLQNNGEITWGYWKQKAFSNSSRWHGDSLQIQTHREEETHQKKLCSLLTRAMERMELLVLHQLQELQVLPDLQNSQQPKLASFSLITFYLERAALINPPL